MVPFNASLGQRVASKCYNLWKWIIRENTGVNVSFSVFCQVNFGADTW